ncbi:MAG: excalibur calcium-binding domain-containing protein [Jatrophihabitantaceae bacterium]
MYANCDSLNRTFPHGVGRSGAVDQVRGSTQPVTSFYVSTWIYNGNTGRDGDHDGIACERL